MDERGWRRRMLKDRAECAVKVRVGLVGSGPIADWHVPALKAAGLEVAAVSSRPGSTRLREFAVRHAIPAVFDGWQAMLNEPRYWDALVIAVHIDGTADILARAMELRVPVLVEKPIAWTSQRLETLQAQAHSKIMVGFNRRFYRTVAFAREEVRSGPPLLAHLNLPEAIDAGQDSSRGRPYWEPFVANSCHGLDLLRFIFGPLRVERVSRTKLSTGRMSGLSAMLSSSRGDNITLHCNWGTPANFSLTLDRPGRRVELKPFELATVYESMDVLEPSSECPIRRYVPKAKAQVTLEDVDARYKPGFVQQAVAFRRMIEGGGDSSVAATIEDALAAVTLCEELTDDVLPSAQN